MTAAHEAPARQDTCRAVRPAPLPCNPKTLGALCVGGCGRRLHTRARNAPKRTCVDGHPIHAGHGRCSGCGQAARRHQETPPDLGWLAQAACRGADLEQFFPDIAAGASFRAATEHVAWRYCHGCPARAACDEFAGRNRELGLWAGAWGRFRGSQYLRTPVIPAAVEVAS